MFKVTWEGRPRPAERPRARFSADKRTYFLYNPPTYQEYQKTLVEFFNKYQEEESLKELFDKKQLVYGLSVKLIFRIKHKGKIPFYGLRPDIDNLYKAVVDALFKSNVNQIENGYWVDKNGEFYLDADGNKTIKYKQKIDDSRVIHTELIKLRVDSEAEEGFTVILRNVGKEDIE